MQLDQHPLQNRIPLRHLQRKDLRTALGIIAESFRGTERADWTVRFLGLNEVHDVNVDLLKILC